MEEIKKKEKNYRVITTSVSKDYYEIARSRGIKWRDALVRGIRVLSEGSNYELELQRQKDTLGRMTERMAELESENEKMREDLQSIRDGTKIFS